MLKTWQRLIELGRDPPEPYYNRPEIEPHLTFLWAAFNDLSTERQIGMAIGPIPDSKLRDYLARELKLRGADYDWARDVLRQADDEYVAMCNASKSKDEEIADAAKVDDADGVKRVMRNLGKKAKSAKS